MRIGRRTSVIALPMWLLYEVQLPEKTDEKSEAHKAGYKNIC